MNSLNIHIIRPQDDVSASGSQADLVFVLLSSLTQMTSVLQKIKFARFANPKGMFLGVSLSDYYQSPALITFRAAVDSMIYVSSVQKLDVPAKILSDIESSVIGIDFLDILQAIKKGNQIFLFCEDYDSADVIPVGVQNIVRYVKQQVNQHSVCLKEMLFSINVNPEKINETSPLEIADLIIKSCLIKDSSEYIVMENLSSSLPVSLRLYILAFTQ